VSLAEEAPDSDAMAKRILVADDSEVMRRQVRAILESDPDLEICAEASTGLEAVQEVQRCRPDLAVVDFLMPAMNGLEATREIKKIAPNLPVVLFTVENSPQLEWESKQAGADALLPKAEGSRQLSELIHTLLQ
jgi:DNA-binding NarL/FixJ family response regulator